MIFCTCDFQVEGIIDGLDMFFPLIPAKREDRFRSISTQNIKHNKEYLEAVDEWKKAQEESNEFANSILQVFP